MIASVGSVFGGLLCRWRRGLLGEGLEGARPGRSRSGFLVAGILRGGGGCGRSVAFVEVQGFVRIVLRSVGICLHWSRRI